MGDAQCAVIFLMFSLLPSVILNYNLYSEGRNRYDLSQNVPEHGINPQMLHNLLSSAVTVLLATQSSLPKSSINELSEDGMPMNQPPQYVFHVAATCAIRRFWPSEAK